MSQKSSKKTRRHTEDELDADFKSPDANKPKEDHPKGTSTEMETVTSDDNHLKDSDNSKNDSANYENGHSPKRTIQTRSRSNTPLIKTRSRSNTPLMKTPENTKNESNGIKEDANGISSDPQEAKDVSNDSKEQPVVENGIADEAASKEASPGSPVEMEPLVIEKEEEEAIPELQFDENDLDLESEGSPSRCRTRRSQTRNMSTPKTPKVLEQEQDTKSFVILESLPEDKSGSSTPKNLESNVGSESQPDEIVDLNDTSDTYSSVSTDNISTRAVAGSDATRNVDFSYQDSGLFEENSYTSSPNRSLGDTLRNLSSRRAIRPLAGEDYRRFALKNHFEGKGDVYAEYEAVERVSVGRKRKNRSTPPAETKRFKDTPGFMSYFSSPISNFKNQFNRSSSPKLVAYEKSAEFDDDVENIKIKVSNKADPEQKWCSIM